MAHPQPSRYPDFLNQAEKDWLAAQQSALRVGITQIPNQVLVTRPGSYKGFSIDLFRKLEEKLGIGFDFLYFDTWEQVIAAARNRQIEIVFLAQKTESRLSYLEFTDTILILRNKIIVHIGNTRNSSPQSLAKARIAVARSSAIQEYLANHYPDAILFPVETEKDALAWVADRSVDAAISEAVRASYYIERQGLDNLRIADDLGYDYYLSIASRSDWPILNIILSKALNDMAAPEIEALQLKWGYAKNQSSQSHRQTFIYLGTGFVVMLMLLLHLYFSKTRTQNRGAAPRPPD